MAVFCSFEPASLPRALAHWNARVPLFSAIEVQRPEALTWGLTSPVATDELRVIMLDAKAAAEAFVAGVPVALSGSASPPLLVMLPSLDAPPLVPPAGAQCDLLDGAAVFAAADIARPLDAEGLRLAGLPFHERAYLALATAVFRRAYARLAPEPKVLAIDCDGTLWQGLCAEAGPHGVIVGPAETALHAFLREQKRAGRLLALVSKNVAEDVEAVFAQRDDLGLSRSDFVAAKVSWQPKSQALRELAAELSLGLDAFVFIDDSPAECAEVASALPEVAVLMRAAFEPARALAAAWLLDTRERTGALGEARTRLYQEEAQRRQAQRAAPSYSEHVRSLAVRTEVRLCRDDEATRVFELAQRTNQFNTAASRPSPEEVVARVAAGEVWSLNVRDRFGDYGASGALFLKRRGAVLQLERWLLSCRVLGRGVEADVFDAVVRLAREQGAEQLALSCERLPRNLPAQRFLDAVARANGAQPHQTEALACELDVRNIGPAPRFFEITNETEQAAPRGTTARAPDWGAVAALTLSQLELAGALNLSVETIGDSEPLAAGDDGVLAVIGDVMGRPVKREDNLYALGADSLRMMRILARLRGRLGLALPVGEILYRADVGHFLELAARARKATAPLVAATADIDDAFVDAYMRELHADL
ncbi:MAG: HAD-IIIC family phosphatase [Myxococcota bacterium]